MLVHLSYLQLLEYTHDIKQRLMAVDLGFHLPQFLKRGWVSIDGYLTNVMVPWLDSEMEVEAEMTKRRKSGATAVPASLLGSWSGLSMKFGDMPCKSTLGLMIWLA